MEQFGMHCSRVKNLLSAYSDRELGGDEMLAVRRHLGDCPECRADHDGYRQVKQLFRSLDEIAPEVSFDPAMLDRPRRVFRRRSTISQWLETLCAEAEIHFHTLQQWSRRMFPTFHSEAQLVAVTCISVAVVAALALQRPQPADAVSAHVPEILASDTSDRYPSGSARLVGYGAPGAGLRALGVIGPDGRVYLFRPTRRDPATDLQGEPYWKTPDYGASLASHPR
jgi:anti-sigma factor RsiW